MRKLLLMSLIILLSCSISNQLSAQTLDIHNIDPSAFPSVRVTYTFKNNGGDEVRNGISRHDIMVTETLNGITSMRDKGNSVCATTETKAASVILVLDMSQSMKNGISGTGTTGDPYTGKSRFEVAKNSIIQLIQQMNPYSTEVAIIGFAAQAYVVHEFSSDQASLLQAVNAVDLNNIIAEVGNGTNYNAAFLWQTDMKTNNKYYDSSSGLHFCKPTVAKYSPTIVFITDDIHTSDVKLTYNRAGVLVGEVLLSEIDTLAKSRGANIYAIQIGESGSNNTILTYLASIGSGSPSTNLKLRVNSEELMLQAMNDIYNAIMKLGTLPNCYFDYITDCNGGGIVDIIFYPGGLSASASSTFTLPNTVKPGIQFVSNDILIKDDDPVVDDIVSDLVINATGNDIQISGYSSSNPKYSLIDLPAVISAGSSATFKLVYQSGTTNPATADSLANETTITLESNACTSSTFNAAWEMIPFLEDVDMGITAQGVSVNKTITQLFCNKTHNTIDIVSLEIRGADKDNFAILSFPAGPLATGDCLEVTFGFNPVSDGTKIADLVLVTSDGEPYTSEIRAEVATSVNDFDSNSKVQTLVFPNPFVKTTAIKYTLPEPAYVSINVFNAIGSRVANIQEGMQFAGDQQALLSGENLSPGVYYYVAQIGETVLSGKLVLLK